MTDSRLQELATEAARARHDHRHVFCPFGENDELICIRCEVREVDATAHVDPFDRCQHPDCTLVRTP